MERSYLVVYIGSPQSAALSQMQLSHRAAHSVVLVNPLPLSTRLQGMALQRETLLNLTAKASKNV